MTAVTKRVQLVAVGPDGDYVPVKADALGNLSVAGAGVASGTQVQLVDGTDTTLKAKVTAAGQLVVDVGDTEFALPAAQVVDLKTVAVSNFPVPVTEVAVNNFPVVQQVENADYEERYEFDAAGNPLYVGKAPDGTATTAAAWTVYKFTFVGGLPTRKQVRENVVWDNRAAVVW